MSIFGTQKAAVQEVKDAEIQQLQADSISALAFSPVADFLAVASWNNEVRIFQIGAGGANEGKASYSHEGPALSVQWSKDGTKVASGGADKAARIFDVSTGQATQVAVHDAPVKEVKWIDMPGSPNGLLATGSWDKTIKYWDVRAPAPVASVQLPERCYTMDVAYPLMVVGTAERHIQIFNLNQPTQVFKSVISPLKMQTRTLLCFKDGSGYTIGSTEGRVAIQYIDDSQAHKSFSFKCHRKDRKEPNGRSKTEVYSVNALSYHPFGTFSTSGSDGTINIWDYESRTRLKTFDDRGGPVTATSFSHTGQYLAYSVGYDWSKGHNGNVATVPNKVYIHTCLEEEVKKRQKK